MWLLNNPVAFNLFGIPVHWYGIIIAVAMVLAIELISREFKRKGFGDDIGYDAALWVIPIGFIGARIYYVLFEWEYYSQHLGEIIQIWNGGIAIYGGVIAGALAMLFYAKRKKFSFFLLTDVATPYLLMAQGIGRWGNFINQEAHGGPVSQDFLSNTLHLPQFIVDNMQIDGTYYHPTFLYESLWNFLGVVLLLLVRHKKQDLKLGETTFLYLIWYAFGRFFIEGLRTDSLYWGPIRVSQALSMVVFVAGIALIIWRRYQYPEMPDYADVKGTKEDSR